MSFSFYAKGKKAEVRAQVEAISGGVQNGQVPLGLRAYLLDNIASYDDDDTIDLSCYGHQRGAWPGDSNDGVATVSVKKITA